MVAVLEHYADDEKSKNCVRPGLDARGGALKVEREPFFLAHGPAVAHEKISRQFQDEELYLQVDSHTFFTQSWDALALKMVRESPEKRAVFSHYPLWVKHPERADASLPVLSKRLVPWFNELSYMSEFEITSRCTREHLPGNYVFSRTIGDTFLLMPGFALREVPFDPSLQNLWTHGEEMLYAARLWSFGYSIFAPSVNLVGHDYSALSVRNGKKQRKVDFEEEQVRKNELERQSAVASARVFDTLRGGPTFSSVGAQWSQAHGYGFGSVRTVDSFFAYIGLSREFSAGNTDNAAAWDPVVGGKRWASTNDRFQRQMRGEL